MFRFSITTLLLNVSQGYGIRHTFKTVMTVIEISYLICNYNASNAMELVCIAQLICFNEQQCGVQSKAHVPVLER